MAWICFHIILPNYKPHQKETESNKYEEKNTVWGKNKVQTGRPKEFLLMNPLSLAARRFNENQ